MGGEEKKGRRWDVKKGTDTNGDTQIREVLSSLLVNCCLSSSVSNSSDLSSEDHDLPNLKAIRKSKQVQRKVDK